MAVPVESQLSLPVADTTLDSAPEHQSNARIRAEAMSPFGRLLLLGVVMLTALMSVLFFCAGVMFPGGVLHFDDAGMIFTGVLFALIWLLLTLFAAMTQNNARLAPTMRSVWTLSFFAAGPVAVLVYWWMHVRTAPYEREDEVER